MKTYILDSLNRFKRYSQNLDVKTILCNKEWLVFNDSGEKEVYIFHEDGTVLVTVNGVGKDVYWKYEPANQSIILIDKENKYMVRPAFVDEVVLALNLDGTEQCMFLIQANNAMHFSPKSLLELKQYFIEKQQIIESMGLPSTSTISDINKAEKEKDAIVYSVLRKTPNGIEYCVSNIKKKYLHQLDGYIDDAIKDKAQLSQSSDSIIAILLIICVLLIGLVVSAYNSFCGIALFVFAISLLTYFVWSYVRNAYKKETEIASILSNYLVDNNLLHDDFDKFKISFFNSSLLK